jgi:ribonuclease R
MAVATDGKISGYRITEATIRSRAQLSYSQVAQLIDGGDTSADYAAMVNTLAELASAMRQHRDSHHIIVKDRPEFRLILNAQGKIERIEPQLKTSAHPLVEECMVAANRCAADMLGQQGLFNCHRGFRPERLRDASKLAEEQLQLSELDLSTPQAYQQVMKAAASLKDAELPVQSVLSRLLERGRLSAELAPHFGMGLAGYTSFTSPIRRFADFIVHRLIKALLKQQDPDYPSQQQLDELQLNLDKSRQARQQMEQWLKCQYLQNQLGNKASGVISQINSRGFTVRLDDNGIEGFVETRSLGKKFSFDPMRLKLNSDDASLQLDMPVKVVIKEVDCAQRSIHFTLDTEPAA